MSQSQQQQILIVELDSISEDIFVCGRCKSIFTSLPLYLEHKNLYCITLHENVISYECNDAESSALKPLEQGLSKDQTSTNLNENKIGGDSDTFIEHLRSHNDNQFQCLVCGRCFTQTSHLKRHEMSHKIWPDNLTKTTVKNIEADVLSYSCMYCDLTFSTHGQFRMHLKNHLSLKKYRCIQSLCSRLFDTIELLMDHVSKDHENLSYSCPHCSQCFKSLNDSLLHQQNKANCNATDKNFAINFKCSQCDAIFKRKDLLECHMLTESHKKKCIHCSKTFSSDKRLRIHLQIHRKDKPYQCNICSQKFSLKKYLNVHLLRHTEERYHICSVCSLRFKRKDTLKRHEKIHQKKKLYNCPFKSSVGCKREFNRSDKLNQHIRLHTKQSATDKK